MYELVINTLFILSYSDNEMVILVSPVSRKRYGVSLFYHSSFDLRSRRHRDPTIER